MFCFCLEEFVHGWHCFSLVFDQSSPVKSSGPGVFFVDLITNSPYIWNYLDFFNFFLASTLISYVFEGNYLFYLDFLLQWHEVVHKILILFVYIYKIYHK